MEKQVKLYLIPRWRIAREKDAMEDYDCIENVQRLCRESKDLFFKTVISTWKDEKYLDVAF